MTDCPLLDWTPPPKVALDEERKSRWRAVRELRIKELPSQTVVQEWLNYDAETGFFTWKKEPRPFGYSLLGKRAGSPNSCGYLSICIPGYIPHQAHRLAWVLFHGSLAHGEHIDHKDLDRANNAIGNLRTATARQNAQNKPVQKNSRSGLKGAYLIKPRHSPQINRWSSQITVDGRIIHLGTFSTAESAHEAYAAAARKYFGEFARSA
jgi:hypothetical protein